ncbi:MAG TPA: DUF6159 family protein [Solirubrobacterales bacterium]|nr:DUF6159 family protein [Solirubrobacterales bacterium]
MRRIRRGWELSKKSWGVLRENRELLRFPLYGAAATIVCAVIVVGPGLYLIDDGEVLLGGPLAVIGFYFLALIGFYFSVGLAATADMIFHGREATVSDGLAVARSRFSQIAGWAAVSTVVGLILSALENQAGIFGQVFSRLLAVGWSLITFLAAPVVALEGTGPFETLKRSGSLFKSRWGQQITGNIAIGGAVFLFGILPSMLLIAAGVLVWASTGFVGALLVVLGVIGFAVAVLISSALSGIFGVALYRYALDGETVAGFTTEELESAVKSKGGRNAPPTATPGTV